MSLPQREDAIKNLMIAYQHQNHMEEQMDIDRTSRKRPISEVVLYDDYHEYFIPNTDNADASSTYDEDDVAYEDDEKSDPDYIPGKTN